MSELEKLLTSLFNNNSCKINAEISNSKIKKCIAMGDPECIVALCLTLIKAVHDEGDISFDAILYALTYTFQDEIKGKENEIDE